MQHNDALLPILPAQPRRNVQTADAIIVSQVEDFVVSGIE